MPKLTIFFLLLSLSLSAWSTTYKIEGHCLGDYRGKTLRLEGRFPDVMRLATGRGSVYFDGREVARFDGEDFKVNVLMKSGTARNSYGDILEAKLFSITTKRALIERLSMRSEGLEIRDLTVQCVTK